MKYIILCLANGEYIKTRKYDIFNYCDMWVRNESNSSIVVQNFWNGVNETQIEFNTREAADWFIRRRLSYNPSRKASGKLMAMNELFEFNGINPLSKKIEYEIHEID